jgi:hypothetical protein
MRDESGGLRYMLWLMGLYTRAVLFNNGQRRASHLTVEGLRHRPGLKLYYEMFRDARRVTCGQMLS